MSFGLLMRTAYVFTGGVNFESFGLAIMVKYKTLKPYIAELNSEIYNFIYSYETYARGIYYIL